MRECVIAIGQEGESVRSKEDKGQEGSRDKRVLGQEEGARTSAVYYATTK